MDFTEEVIVIGAGQAGLSASYFLQQEGVRHIVLEQKEIGYSWISQRWNSFKMNTPNWMTWLPGMELSEEIREHFMTKDEFVKYLKNYVHTFKLPVMEGYKVVQLQREKNLFRVVTENNGQQTQWRSRFIVIASGIMNKVKRPPLSRFVPKNIVQIYASEYRDPQQLSEGNILLVGAAQSGCQIAEELALAGRKVYLASSKVARAPRRYKGKDVMEWMDLMGGQDISLEEAKQNPKFHTTQPQSSGKGLFGHTISYQSLNRMGITVLGSLKEVGDEFFHFEDNATAHIRFADETSANIKNSIDLFCKSRYEIIPSQDEQDEADFPDKNFISACCIVKLHPRNDNITTIIWAIGFGYDFSYMDTKLLDATGKPQHFNGKISNGLYCLGFPWLRKKKSGLVYGVREDAEIIVKEILSEKNQQDNIA